MMGHTASEGLETLLKDYLSTRKYFKQVSDYDDRMKVMRQNYDKKIDSIDFSLKPVAQHLFEIADNSYFIFEIIQWKIKYIADGLLHSLQTKNPITLANNARSLLEHIATISLIGNELSKLENSLRGQQSEDTIRNIIKRSKSFLYRVYYGKSPKIAKKKEDKAIHISESLIVLCQIKKISCYSGFAIPNLNNLWPLWRGFQIHRISDFGRFGAPIANPK